MIQYLTLLRPVHWRLKGEKPRTITRRVIWRKIMHVLDAVAQSYLREDIPEMNVGDTVRVHIKIVEGSRERIQVFEGYILKMQGGGIGATYTVRRIASGVGVEKTFPVHSPKVDHIEVIKHGFVRRAKLNFMRGRTGKSAKMRAEKEY